MDTYTTQDTKVAFQTLVDTCHLASKNGGWWTDLETGEPITPTKNVPEKLMLIVTEVAEAMEAHRKGLMDDKLPHHTGVRVELCDTIIRCFDLLGALDDYEIVDMKSAEAFVEKIEYNANREDHKLENRKKEGGKKV